MISIDWNTRIIYVPQSYLTLVSGIVYQLDVEQFRLDLKDLEDSEEGMSFPVTHRRNAPVILSGITYAQSFEIINGYTITFEDTGSHYSVQFTGANHNIADVTNFDAVNLIIGNSAGLIEVATGSGPTPEQIADAVWDELKTGHNINNSYGKIVQDMETQITKLKQLLIAFS